MGVFPAKRITLMGAQLHFSDIGILFALSSATLHARQESHEFRQAVTAYSTSTKVSK